MTPPRRYSLALDAVLRPAGGEALLLKLSDETMFSLNPSGARIVQLILEGRHLEAVVDALTAEFRSNRTDVERDVEDLLHALVTRGLLIPSNRCE